MTKVFLPKEVAEAVEKIWDGAKGSNLVKHLYLNNWGTLSLEYPEESVILSEYANENPVNYMQALVQGYEIDFNDAMQFIVKDSTSVLDLSFDTNKENLKVTSCPIYIGISEAGKINAIALTIDQAKEVINGLQSLLQELNKVRTDI